MAEPLLIIGASVRAAAQSAAHAGFKVTAVDLFGDEDLRACSPQVLVAPRQSYPHGLADLALSLPPQPWMYTGGLENYPDLVARISTRHTLLGNGPDVLRAVRDPFLVVPLLHRAGFDVLPVCRTAQEIPPGETWLKKPLRSSGGEHVRFVRTDERADNRPSSTHYYQRYQPGLPASAAFVASGGRAVLIGVSEQLLGEAWGARSPFMYAGSIGPLGLTAAVQSHVERLGQMLADHFQLVGLFGVDGVFAADTFWPVEINPRYTASMELYEGGGNTSLVAAHFAACRAGSLREALPVDSGVCRGKAVLYAKADGRIPAQFLTSLRESVADIPAAGSHFGFGEPVCTVLVGGTSSDDVRTRLHEMLTAARGLLSVTES